MQGKAIVITPCLACIPQTAESKVNIHVPDRTSSGPVISGSRRQGQGRKQGRRKGQDKGKVWPLPQVPGAVRHFSTLSIWGTEADTFRHQLLSPTGHQVPCTSGLHVCVLRVEGGVLGLVRGTTLAQTRCYQAVPVRGDGGPWQKRPRGLEVATKRCPRSQLLRTPVLRYLLRAGHNEIALSPVMIS